MVRLFTLVAGLALAGNLAAQSRRPIQFQTYEVKYTCNDGRYTIKYAGEARHYCFDKVHYWEKQAPAHVKEYFRQLKEEQALKDAEFQAAFAEHDQKIAELRQQHSGPAAAPLAVAVGRSARGPQRRPTSRAVAAAPVAPRKVADDLVREISAGQARSEVIAKLGQPAGRMAGLANGGEVWTYLLESGGSAKVKLENDAVTAVGMPR